MPWPNLCTPTWIFLFSRRFKLISLADNFNFHCEIKKGLYDLLLIVKKPSTFKQKFRKKKSTTKQTDQSTSCFMNKKQLQKKNSYSWTSKFINLNELNWTMSVFHIKCIITFHFVFFDFFQTAAQQPANGLVTCSEIVVHWKRGFLRFTRLSFVSLIVHLIITKYR